MKAIAVFSGKGGVGKSTIAALLALALSKERKTVLLDADIGTPSIPILFGKRKQVDNLFLVSTGTSIDDDIPITFTGGMVRSALRSLIKTTLALEPEVCVLDLPPGTGSVQMELCTKHMMPSAALLVSQSNRLSESDASRAMQLFMTYGVPILGIIENMAGDVFGKTKKKKILGLPVVASIELNKELAIAGSSGKIYNIGKNPLDKVAEKMLKKAGKVDWKIVKDVLLEGPSMDSILELDLKTARDKSGWKFFGTNTWDHVRHRLMKLDLFGDRFLSLCTASAIRKMLDHLDDEGQGMFQVIRAPHTEVPLFAGEIGMAHLKVNPSYYGVPKVEYFTDKGNVTLFPYEVAPTTHDKLLSLLEVNEMIRMPKSSHARYIPMPEIMEQIYHAFGLEAGVTRHWRKKYEDIGLLEEV